MKLYKKRYHAPKIDSLILFICIYVDVSYMNYVYMHILKMNSEKYNMYVVGSYIKYIYIFTRRKNKF